MSKLVHIAVSVTKDQLVHVVELCNMLINNCPNTSFMFHTIVDAKNDELQSIESLMNGVFLSNNILFKAYSLQQLFDSIKFPSFIYEKLCTMYHRCLYARLFLDKLGVNNFNTILSLDTDIVISSLDVNKLFNVNLDGNYAAGALDIYNVANNKVELRNAKCLNEQHYINCGVVLFNTKMIRDCHVSSKLLHYMKNAPSRLYYQNVGDQTFFNYAFSHQCKILDAKFNLQVSAFSDYANSMFNSFGYKSPYSLFKHGVIYQSSDKYYWWDPQYEYYLESMKNSKSYHICKVVYEIYLKNKQNLANKTLQLGTSQALEKLQHMKT